MTRWPLLAALALSAVVGGVALRPGNTGRTAMTTPDLMNQLQVMLEDEHHLALKPIDCRAYYEAGYKGSNACYGSSVETKALVSMLQRALDKLAFSGGWSEDYGVWGSFYETRDGHKQTFGITVNPVQGNEELQAIAAVRPFNNFVTVTVDRPKSAR